MLARRLRHHHRPAAIRAATTTIGMTTAMAVFPPLESPPSLELLLPLVAPARPTLFVDVDDDEVFEAGAVADDVTVTKTVLPG